MPTIPPIIYLICGEDICAKHSLLQYACDVGEIYIDANNPSYNMHAMWGNSSVAMIPSYNMPVMWGGYWCQSFPVIIWM